VEQLPLELKRFFNLMRNLDYSTEGTCMNALIRHENIYDGVVAQILCATNRESGSIT